MVTVERFGTWRPVRHQAQQFRQIPAGRRHVGGTNQVIGSWGWAREPQHRVASVTATDGPIRRFHEAIGASPGSPSPDREAARRMLRMRVQDGTARGGMSGTNTERLALARYLPPWGHRCSRDTCR